MSDNLVSRFRLLLHPRFLALLLVSLACLSTSASATNLRNLPVVDAAVTDHVALPVDGVRGVFWGSGTIWLLASEHRGRQAPVGPYRSALLRLDPSTGRADTVRVQVDAYQAGLTFDGEAFWSGGSVIGADAGVYQIAPGGGRILRTLPSPGYHPTGIAWDGEWLWQVDASSRKLYRLEPEEGRVSRKTSAPGFYPTGLAFDGDSFWSADASTGRLYRIAKSSGRPNAVVSAEAFYYPGAFVSLDWHRGGLWVVVDGQREARRLELLP